MNLEPPVIGYKYGPRQWWPVWSWPPVNFADIRVAKRLGISPVVGGPCPPDLHVGGYGEGYSCIPHKGVGQESSTKENILLGIGLLVIVGIGVLKFWSPIES